jgi:cell division protein ZipA
VPILDLPMMANPEPHPDPAEDVDYIEASMPGPIDGEALPEGNTPAEQSPMVSRYATARSAVSPAAVPTQAPLNLGSGTEHADSSAAAEPAAPNLSEQQKIVTLRVCAVGDSRWSGRDLMSVLEGHGLAYGRYQVYHRKHADGQSIFFVASLIEPGTFDAARMAEEEFRGVSMFAVLPGPIEPLQAVDALFTTARDLARDLSGTVQDAKGIPFSPQRIATLREDVARFQSSSRGPAA